MKTKRVWKLQSRRIECFDGKIVYASPWFDHLAIREQEGCLSVGWFTRAEALKWKKLFERDEKKAGCSNFQYQVI